MAHAVVPARVTPSAKRAAAGFLDQFNMDNARAGWEEARPYAYGATALIGATVLDGFGKAMDWHYPKFMRDNFLGKIDWRVYGAVIAAGAYMLEADSEYADWQTTTAAIGVALVGSWALTSLWGGAEDWGRKLGGWVGSFGKKDEAPAAALAPSTEAPHAGGFMASEDFSGAANPDKHLNKLRHRLQRLEKKEGKIRGELQQITPPAPQAHAHAPVHARSQEAGITLPDGRFIPRGSPAYLQAVRRQAAAR